MSYLSYFEGFDPELEDDLETPEDSSTNTCDEPDVNENNDELGEDLSDIEIDDLEKAISDMSDEDFDFDDEDDDDFTDTDVTDAIDPEDDVEMDAKVQDVPEENLSAEEKKAAADAIATAVPTMLIKSEMDATESYDFFTGVEVGIALNEGLLTMEEVQSFLEELTNVPNRVLTEGSLPPGNKTIVRFSKQALLARIKGICTMKLARAHHDPDVPKYAKACKQRRFFKARMKQKYGREANKQARMILIRMRQSKSKAIKSLSGKVADGEKK